MSGTKPTYVSIALICLKDFGTFAGAIRYCKSVASQQGEDAVVYQMAAESLSDALDAMVVAGRHERGRRNLAS